MTIEILKQAEPLMIHIFVHVLDAKDRISDRKADRQTHKHMPIFTDLLKAYRFKYVSEIHFAASAYMKK